MENSKHYNSSYSKVSKYTLPMSLLSFVRERATGEDAQEVLEVGCGIGTLYLELKNDLNITNYNALDFSSVAIDEAKKKYHELPINFINADILDFKTAQKFDLIIDSHLLHCLQGRVQIQSYFEKIHSLLNVGGKFICETMIAGKSFMQGDHDFRDDHLLFENGKIIRTILPHLELEKMILNSGLAIEYFSFPLGVKMIPYGSRNEVMVTDPDVVRFVLKKHS
jgi:SAM-dependent methyltransferase